jgi:poly(A)-specific ribonuclease
MDVDKTSFYPLLLDILTDISTAKFVTIDLELSGIPTKDPSAGKPNLQQRYLETKEAAERYQILQIGITCVEEDASSGKYNLKPYNFDLSPVINERGLDIERIFSYQSGAAEFLLKVGFDMGRPFTHGVPYLSRAESKLAREKFVKRNDRGAVADIVIKPTEVESLAFLARVRSQVDDWVASTSPKTPEYLNIVPFDLENGNNTQKPEELSRFEKRLVHQIVRAEYPELTTISRRGMLQIIRFDQEREDRIAEGRKRELEERISRQKGFRWIIDAMHGGNITNLDLRECARDSVTGEYIFVNMDGMKEQFHRAQALLRNNPKVLVGHNCFLDLVYIYRTFIGTLPDTVEEFQTKLHKLWPTIVDTKYMSTHNCGDISPASSLEQIAEQLSALETPIVDVDAQHSKYKDFAAFHEAGYDSFLTAQVAVRLSAKLEREGAYIDPNAPGAEVQDGMATMQLTEATLATHGSANGKTSNPNEVNGQADGTDSLREASGFTPSVPGLKWKGTGEPTLEPTNEEDFFKYDPKDRKPRGESIDTTIPGGMPRFGSDFWRTYGNKLRVFGTQEGVCVLDASAEWPTSDDGGVEV